MRFGPYELLLPLAKGGMAEVFVAVRDGATEACIVKRVHEHLASNENLLNRFRREAEVAVLLDHPNIARVVDAGFVDGRFYIGMELVWGADLATLIAAATPEAPLPVGAAVAIGAPLLAALGHAHALRSPDDEAFDVVHRDVSARNVLVDRFGDVKLIDFGMARAKMGHFRTAAQKFIAGTPPYMSPEQALGRPLDPRSDLYSVGVLLYELLTGRRLVENGPVPEMLERVVRARPQPVASLRPEVPADLSDVVARALARYSNDRWPNAAAFEAALRACSVPPLERDALAELVRANATDVEAKRQEIEARLASIRGVPAVATAVASRSADGATTAGLGTDGATTIPMPGEDLGTRPRPSRSWMGLVGFAALVLAAVWFVRGGFDPTSAPVSDRVEPTAIAAPVPTVSAAAPIEDEAPRAVPAKAPGDRPPSAVPSARAESLGDRPPSTVPTARDDRPPPKPAPRDRVKARPRTRPPPPAAPPPATETEPPPPDAVEPTTRAVSVGALLARARRLRGRLDATDPRRDQVDLLLSELIVLGSSAPTRARMEDAERRLERLERPRGER